MSAAVTRDPVVEYHDLMSGGGAADQLAADTQARLDAQMHERGILFGDRPLCTVLRPRFMRAAQYSALQKRAGRVPHEIGRAHV